MDIAGYVDPVEVSRGEDAVVFRAWQPAFNRSVTVHLLPTARADDVEARVRRTAALAGHPNVVTVHAFGVTDEGVPYLVTELLEGGSVAERIARAGAPDWYEAASLTVKVAAVVQAAAEHGVTGLAVGPGDVTLSRFGEPKVSLFLRRAQGGDLDALHALLQALLGEDAALPRRFGGASELIALLQRAQQDAGRPVTELPSESAAGTAGHRPLAEDLTSAPTVAPDLGPTTPRGRKASIAAALVLAAAGIAFAGVLRRDPPTTRTATPTTVAPTSTVPSERPLEPPLHVADFRSGRPWQGTDATPSRGTVVDGQFRAEVQPRGGWVASVTGTPAGERLSVSVTAQLRLQPDARLGVICGTFGAGFKYLAAWLGPTGNWELEDHTGVLSRGSAPQRQAELDGQFVMRLDCVTDRSPVRATLLLNDRPLGTAEGGAPFPMPGIGVGTRNQGTEPFELTIGAFSVRRLG